MLTCLSLIVQGIPVESEGNVGGSDPAAPVGGTPTAPTGLSPPSSTTPTQPTAGSGGTHTKPIIYTLINNSNVSFVILYSRTT